MPEPEALRRLAERVLAEAGADAPALPASGLVLPSQVVAIVRT